MFRILSGERRRRGISPATFLLSAGAHFVLLGGVVYAADRAPSTVDVLGPVLELPPLPEEALPPPAAEIERPPAPPPTDDTTLPVPGDRVDLVAPTDVPDEIVPEAPGVTPMDVSVYERDGQSGDYVGPKIPGLTQPTGTPNPPVVPDFVIPEHLAERRPELDRSGLARALERYYPTVLRDSRVEGRVLIELVVEEDGTVRAGSARVVEASHRAFGDAALRAVERFRFTPAEVGGIAVAVRVTIPIAWSVPR